MRLTVLWQARERLSRDYTVLLHLADTAGQTWSVGDAPPRQGHYPTSRWRVGDVIRDTYRLAVNPDLPCGAYHLEVGLYDPQTDDRLATVSLLRLKMPCAVNGTWPRQVVAANLGGRVELVGFDVESGSWPLKPGQSRGVSLYWRALSTMTEDYTVFLHLVNEEGTIVAQTDRQPLAGRYPTSVWDVGEMIRDDLQFTIPTDAVQGRYRLVAGMYLLATMGRLPVVGAEGDAVVLGEVEVRG